MARKKAQSGQTVAVAPRNEPAELKTSQPAESQQNSKFIILGACLVSGIVLLVYALTLAPTVTLVDSGELIIAARYLGVAHPPGFPLYVMLAHLATLFPFGNVAIRVNFASALFASVACGLAFFAVMEILRTSLPQTGKSKKTVRSKRASQQRTDPDFPQSVQRVLNFAPAIIAGLLLGFSRTLWAYGTITEVYTLNTMILVAIYFLMIRWRRKVLEAEAASERAGAFNGWSLRKEDRPLYIAALMFGLGLGDHHVTIGLNLLALAGFVLVTEGVRFFKSSRLLYCFLISVCGLAVYIYLPLAASRGPVMNWGNPNSLGRLWQHVTGRQYQVFLQGGDTAKLAGQFFEMAGREFGPAWLPFVVLLAIAGFVWLYKKRDFAVITFLALVIVADVGYGLSYEIAEDKDAYFLPVFVVMVLAAGLGVRWLLELAVSRGLTGARLWTAAAAMLVVPAISLASNLPFNNKHHYFIAHDYVDNILGTVAQNGMVLTMDWQVYSPMMYEREVEGVRRDVVSIDVNLLRRSWYFQYLSREYPDLMNKNRDNVNAFLQDLTGWEQNPGVYDTDPALNRRINDRFNQMILGFISNHIKSAPVYLTEDIMLDFGGGNPGLLDTINKTYGSAPQGLVFQLQTAHDYHELAELHLQMRGLFDGSIAFDPDDVVAQKVIPAYLNMLLNRGRYYAAFGHPQQAIQCYREVLKLKPDYQPAKTLLDHSPPANGSVPAGRQD